MMIGQIFLALFLAILLGLGISYFQDILPDFPGYASTLFANAMVIGQLWKFIRWCNESLLDWRMFSSFQQHLFS